MTAAPSTSGPLQRMVHQRKIICLCMVFISVSSTVFIGFSGSRKQDELRCEKLVLHVEKNYKICSAPCVFNKNEDVFAFGFREMHLCLYV